MSTVRTPQQNTTRIRRRRLAKVFVFCLALTTCLVTVGTPVRADTPTPPPFRGQTDGHTSKSSRTVANNAPQLTRIVVSRKIAQARRVARARKAALARKSALARKVVLTRDAVAPTAAKPEANPSPALSLAVSIGFQPDVHGFTFSNWSAATASDDADIVTARRLFGDASVCADISDGACRAYDRVVPFLERLNAELDKGRCEGIVLLAFERFRVGSSASTSVTRDDVVQELNYWSATQVLPGARERTRESRSWDVQRIVTETYDDLRRGGGSVLGLYQNDVAHSVLPVSLEVVDGVAKIGVYDPNHPLSVQTVVINLNGGSWSYTSLHSDGSPAMTWSGSAIGGLSLVPLAARTSTEVDYFRS